MHVHAYHQNAQRTLIQSMLDNVPETQMKSKMVLKLIKEREKKFNLIVYT